MRYDMELMLSKIKRTFLGLDHIPFWVFQKCSYELTDVVAHIFNVIYNWICTNYLAFSHCYSRTYDSQTVNIK